VLPDCGGQSYYLYTIFAMRKHGLGWPACLMLISLLMTSCKGKSPVPAETLTLKPCSLHVKTYLHNDPNNISLDMSLSLQFPSEFSDQKILSRVRAIVQEDFFPEADSMFTSGQALLEAYAADYKRFFDATETTYGEDGSVDSSRSWTNQVSMTVHYNQNYLFSYSLLTEQYTGGAHGGKTWVNRVIDLRTGESIDEDELFATEAKKQLTELIIHKIMNQYHATQLSDLEDIGFFGISDLTLNHNFYLDDKGLTYTYNEYEIAAYAVGAVHVFIPYEELTGFLKEGNPLSAMLS